jgi:SulP family sulfate permease
VEWCENQVLHTLQSSGIVLEIQGIQARLERALNCADCAQTLIGYLERLEVEKSYYLMHQGDPPRGLYFVESGQITIQLERSGAAPIRLRKMSAGTIVGEMGVYLNRPASASVITNQPSTLYFLSVEGLGRLAQEYPAVATAFHTYMARFLAERLTQTTETLRALAD